MSRVKSGMTMIFPSASLATTSAWPTQGEWTYADYLRLPDDGQRYEVIEGVLYVVNAPSYEYQYTTTKIASKLEQFVDASQAGVVLTAPFEVHLPDIAQPVQPDVLFIPADKQPEAGAQIFTGAPALIVEVLSPSRLRLDQHIKFGAYEQARVREYWIADPKTRSVIVYILPQDSREYAVSGQFAPGEITQSAILPGLQLAVESIFVHRGTP